MNQRPSIPDQTKRNLRQESFFGCCVCGNPIVQYHHIIPWEVERHFREKDMMCLCPDHHDEATKGAMVETEQRKYKLAPFNTQKGYVSGKLKINHNVPIVDVGNCNFVGDGNFISVDDKTLLKLDTEGDSLLISIKLFDENNELGVEIVNNEWISGDSRPWDIISSYQYLKVWYKKSKIGLEINTKKYPINISARLMYKNQRFDINKKGMFFNGVITDITVCNFSFVGIHFVANIKDKILQLIPDARFNKGKIVAGRDIDRCIEAWKKLNSNIA